MNSSKFWLGAHRAPKIAAVALLGMMATCGDDPTTSPIAGTASPDVDPTATPAVLSSAITQTLLTSGNNTANQSAYTTASISPAPNALITLAVLGHRSYGASPSPVITGGGMAAWEEVATITFDPVGSPLKRMTLYRAMSASPGSGPITIQFSGSQSHAQWIVSQWEGVDLGGTNGSGAIVQTGSARADLASGLEVTLAAFENANNVALGVFGVKSSVVAITPGGGFTEIAEVPSTESPHSDLQAQWATNDNTVDASWVNLNGAGLGVEIRAGAPAEPPPPPPPVEISPSLSTVTSDLSSITAGTGTATITVTVKDVNDAPVSGATVVLSATGDGNTLTQPTGPTDASGVATGTLSSTVAGTKTVSATANGTAITQTVAIEVTEAPPPPPPPTTHPVLHTLLTSGNHTTNQSTYTTASISPAPNALVTVAVLGHNSSSAAPAPTISGGGMAEWTQVATVTFDALSKPLKRMALYRAMSASPGSGPITIRFSKSQSNAQWIVSQWDGVDVSGDNGAGAIVQIGSERADATNGLTATLAPLGNENNVGFGVFGVRSDVAAVTPGTGFTEIAEHASGESPPSALQAQWRYNDNTIDASWTNLRGAVLAVEIKAGEHAGPPQPVVSVEVAPATASILVGGTVQLTATAQNAEGEPLPGRPATWATDAPSVASVSSTGLVKGEGAGTATITATIEGKTGTSTITVTTSTVPVASVDVSPASASLPVGGTVQLTATPRDAAGQPLSDRTVTWSTNAPSIATVSSTGVVTGVAEGPATITATSEGKSGTSSVTVTSAGDDALVGRWSSVLPAPMVLVHSHLLHDGRVLVFGKAGEAQVWNPATGQFTRAPAPALVFCAGHDWLPDGRLFVVGGHIAPSRGLAVTNIFDPATATWQVAPEMAQGRWYPSTTTLPNGEVVAISGEDASGNTVPIPEVWNGSSWRRLTGASLSLANYPRTFVAPDGRIFVAGASRQTAFLDVTGAGSWTNGPQRQFGGRNYGAAVMYEPGKIIYIGGSNPPTNTAEIIDLNQPNPQWSFTGSLAVARWNHNATLLPTGEILVTGGVAGDRSNQSLKVNTTELWNPATGSWRTLAPSAPLLRGYHSSSLLLPDGRILHGGGGDGGSTPENLDYEIYSPPYLFRGARPAITGATPGQVSYGQQVFVETPDAASITKVSFIRFGSVTHAMDWAQRFVPLSFTPVAGGISVTIPTSRTAATPGPYMLFLVNGNGVPSVGRIMLLR